MVVKFEIKGRECLIDEVDADLLERKWGIEIGKGRTQPYISRTTHIGGKAKHQSLHRLIMARMLKRELIASEAIDHIDNNPLNNLRSNLRLATTAQNAANRPAAKTNKLGVKGVVRIKSGKYVAHIGFNSKDIYLGTFDTVEEAHAAYLNAAKKYFGDFARGE